MTEDKLLITLKELELVQLQINKYDDLAARIKTWAITLWLASLGWLFQTHNKHILLVNIVMVISFWMLDIINKNFREDYKNRREEISIGLASFFKNNIWPEKFFSPQNPKHEIKYTFKNLFRPHLALNYLSLLLISLLFYFLK